MDEDKIKKQLHLALLDLLHIGEHHKEMEEDFCYKRLKDRLQTLNDTWEDFLSE